ncbi:MAG: PA14 domain-containing protein, partial [Anaerolineae bacterium]
MAIIGENAHWAQIMGGGSSQVNPHRAVSPLAGIQARVGDETTVTYEVGTLIHKMPPLLEMDWLTAADGRSSGLTLSYYHNLELAGEAAHRHVIGKSEFSWFGTVNPFVDPTNFSMRLEGTLTVPVPGAYQLHLWSIGRARLLVDGQVVIDHWQGDEIDRKTAVSLNLTPDKPVSILVEYITDPGSRWRTLRLGCVPP